MIGTTSWMFPGTYLENAKALEGVVDFVELLVYTWDCDTRRLLFSELPKLSDLSLEYTVHLPTDNSQNAVKALRFFMDSGFDVLNYVLHPLKGWEKVAEISSKVSLENLRELIVPYGRMTFDVGHHLLGVRFPEHLKNRVVEIHAMGVEEGRDHIALNNTGLKEVLRFYREGVLVNFEVFDFEDLKRSLEIWRHAYERHIERLSDRTDVSEADSY